ncbi:MAG: GGDEF domain-containing protein [gamma proteobacterium endosymbiont of Lamellibrachia anaximandri]|nr:GGDEF domain-containing protein [gamma proteobacterium endosymbiont of Lamellibrachia anaximandri]MBL3535484.1 GGDEF domain-containing protein [gamma proteobacterium endosymbiont of Lamellibrachia anaximandri]MBL3598622.1 GGDEF domain-containing protein [gamma proteobacterium endosymbiont of Lamellibrachia anaximandri]
MTGYIQSLESNSPAGVSLLPKELARSSEGGQQIAQVVELTTRLQTTLELENLIELFFDVIKSHFKYDGATFQLPGNALTITTGEQCRHNINYSLKVLDQPLGDIGFSRSRRFKDVEAKLLENLLTTLLYPLRNALLYREAIQSAFVDSLTGVKNRTAFDSNFHREVELGHRNGSELSLIVLDIDFFKKVNDQYGHSIGDYVLKCVAQAVEATIRSSDALYRYGGEEFTVVLSGTDQAGALLLAERIRQNIEALVFASSKGLSITMSLGVATLNSNEESEHLFIRADEALYQAKEKGRNQVAVAE